MKKLSFIAAFFILLPILTTCSQTLNPFAEPYIFKKRKLAIAATMAQFNKMYPIIDHFNNPNKPLSSYLGLETPKMIAWKGKQSQTPNYLKDLDNDEDLPSHRIFVASKYLKPANSPLSRDIFGSAL